MLTIPRRSHLPCPSGWLGRDVLRRCESSVENRKRIVNAYRLKGGGSNVFYVIDNDAAGQVAAALQQLITNRTIIHCHPGPGSLPKAFVDVGAKSVRCLEPNQKFASFMQQQQRRISKIHYLYADVAKMDVFEKALEPACSSSDIMQGIDSSEWDSEASAVLVGPFARKHPFYIDIAHGVCARHGLFQWGRLPVIVGIPYTSNAHRVVQTSIMSTTGVRVILERVFDIVTVCELSLDDVDPRPSPPSGEGFIRIFTLTPKKSDALPSVADFELLLAFLKQLWTRPSQPVSSQLVACGCSATMLRSVLDKALLRGSESVVEIPPAGQVRLFNAFQSLSNTDVQHNLLFQDY